MPPIDEKPFIVTSIGSRSLDPIPREYRNEAERDALLAAGLSFAQEVTQFARAALARFPKVISRDGGARGADLIGRRAFQAAGGTDVEVYLPTDLFDYARAHTILRHVLRDNPDHFANICKKEYTARLHQRDILEVIGRDFQTPSDVVLYSSPREGPDGLPIGGTKTAVALATEIGIPCFNLFSLLGRQRLQEYTALGMPRFVPGGAFDVIKSPSFGR